MHRKKVTCCQHAFLVGFQARVGAKVGENLHTVEQMPPPVIFLSLLITSYTKAHAHLENAPSPSRSTDVIISRVSPGHPALKIADIPILKEFLFHCEVI